MVNYDAKVYKLTDEGMQGIEVIISDDSEEVIESIQVTNQTQFNALIDRLEDLGLSFPAFADGSTIAGRSIDALLRNSSEDVDINATTLNGFQSDDFSKSGHVHDDRYYTESEMDSKLSQKSNTSHTHGWTNVSTGSEYSSLIVNPTLRLAFYAYYREGYAGFKNKANEYVNLGSVPSGYAPLRDTHVTTNTVNQWGVVETGRAVRVARSSAVDTATINFEVFYIY